jgi:hypothetical protein
MVPITGSHGVDLLRTRNSADHEPKSMIGGFGGGGAGLSYPRGGIDPDTTIV